MKGFGKLIYKADIDGSLTVEQQITQAEHDSIHGDSAARNFEKSLIYDITRTVTNIFANTTITYAGSSNEFTLSLQKKLIDIFFKLHDKGYCFLELSNTGAITGINDTKGQIKLVDPAYQITKVTQKEAAHKALEFYGVVTNALYSVIDERGVMGMFTPQSGTEIKVNQKQKFYEAFKTLFGIKKGQRKFIVSEVPMSYSGVSIPVNELQLRDNKKDAVGAVAKIYGIGEDMIQSGAIYANKEMAIIQTYSDYKGLVYNWITQIEEQQINFRNINYYDITFPGVPQMNKSINLANDGK